MAKIACCDSCAIPPPRHALSSTASSPTSAGTPASCRRVTTSRSWPQPIEVGAMGEDEARRVIRLRNRLEELDRLHPFVAEFCQDGGVPAEESFALSLALDELVTNVIEHGYADGAEHEI